MVILGALAEAALMRVAARYAQIGQSHAFTCATKKHAAKEKSQRVCEASARRRRKRSIFDQKISPGRARLAPKSRKNHRQSAIRRL